MLNVLFALIGCGSAGAEVEAAPPVTQFVQGWANDFCAQDDPCWVEWKDGLLLVWGRSDTQRAKSYTYFSIEVREDELGEVPTAFRTGRNLRPLAAWTMEPEVRAFLDRAKELDCGKEGSCTLRFEKGELALAPPDLLVDDRLP